MSTIEESIEVGVPVRTAYNQWTQFEDFPHFMEGVKEIQQVTDSRLRWKAEIAGQEREWESEITEQLPDERIAWTGFGGADNAGVLTFHRLDDNKSRVMLQMEFQPEGAVEAVGDAVGAVKARVKGDLKRYKEFLESQGQETGAWRGEIKQDNVG
jgi:uncharacterized membrane protein